MFARVKENSGLVNYFGEHKSRFLIQEVFDSMCKVNFSRD